MSKTYRKFWNFYNIKNGNFYYPFNYRKKYGGLNPYFSRWYKNEMKILTNRKRRMQERIYLERCKKDINEYEQDANLNKSLITEDLFDTYF